MLEEDRLFREYLEAHGYDISQMGFKDDDELSQQSLPEKDTDTKEVDA